MYVVCPCHRGQDAYSGWCQDPGCGDVNDGIPCYFILFFVSVPCSSACVGTGISNACVHVMLYSTCHLQKAIIGLKHRQWWWNYFAITIASAKSQPVELFWVERGLFWLIRGCWVDLGSLLWSICELLCWQKQLHLCWLRLQIGFTELGCSGLSVLFCQLYISMCTSWGHGQDPWRS